ncbi:glycerophosphoryl diester phosphodiesterase membrane domain-containing protein [Microbacterium sp. SSM24]|uniref:glycerophosphoryl diester phosphodiesterase membrane domain-containing protein n=1 Tax=Microbacterium sp. SSM24 TaxID=2991714 RepID=UPI0022275A8B|nr:glycerophosphoryl diester phosphodiesterase membrane domain-containing protein [Microbacterium sp. SSM24]MCW3493786.1 glycerophosphoryl diester phosphodiesterase membrane domain-containing protein [Microbacterium sp. SSM24]
MTAYPAWTPASRPGIIPLHPLSFGTVLGRSFSALRSNPRVLLGFALVVQTLAYLIVIAAVGAIAFASFSRLATLQPGSDEYDAVTAGSTAITIIAGFILGLAAGALGVIVQGIVVTEVAHAAVAEKLTLGALWRQVKPAVWRLIGYSLLLMLVIVAALAVVAVTTFAIAATIGPAAILLMLLVFFAAIPLTLWLSVKLLLVPAAIILEGATIGRAIARSWTLTRRRFWPTLGVIVLISMVFGFVAQAVSLPFTLLGSGLGTIIAPTGEPDATATIGLIVSTLFAQAVTLVIQSVAIVVQSTATAIIYIDCRMRHEGLDLDLLAYVERRDAGATALADPYRENIGRAVVRPVYGFPPAYGAPGAYPPYGQPAAPPAYGAYPPYGQPAAPPAYAAPPPLQAPYGQSPAYAPYGQPPVPPAPYGQPPAYAAPAQPAGAAPPVPETPPEPAAPTSWTAPGAPADGVDRESPWA